MGFILGLSNMICDYTIIYYYMIIHGIIYDMSKGTRR